MMSNTKLKKIVMLGTTGSGKTTFLENLIGEFNGAEVPRNATLEEMERYNTFSPIDGDDFLNSTTTISMNAKTVLFLTTRTNEFKYYPYDKNKLPLPKEEIDCVYPSLIIDTAGQERFNFMQDWGVKGADAAFIFADGSNTASIERVSHFINMIKEEENEKQKYIPITVFVNKKDLEERGLFVGAASIARWIDHDNINIDETSNYDPDSFLIPLRNVLDKLEGFPLSLDKFD